MEEIRGLIEAIKEDELADFDPEVSKRIRSWPASDMVAAMVYHVRARDEARFDMLGLSEVALFLY